MKLIELKRLKKCPKIYLRILNTLSMKSTPLVKRLRSVLACPTLTVSTINLMKFLRLMLGRHKLKLIDIRYDQSNLKLSPLALSQFYLAFKL
jgi:hypothetical protein